MDKRGGLGDQCLPGGVPRSPCGAARPGVVVAHEKETQEIVMVGLPKPFDIQKMLDGFHMELHAIRTLLEQLLELERERIERDPAA
jgi:hypothetical protein